MRLENLPPWCLDLLLSGLIEIKKVPKVPSPIGDTFGAGCWNQRKKRYDIFISNNTPDEAIAGTLRHEIGHLALGHWHREEEDCRNLCRMISDDIEVNQNLALDGEFDSWNEQLGGGLVNSPELLTALKLDPNGYYTSEVLHHILHVEIPKGQQGGVCGGFSNVKGPKAMTAAYRILAKAVEHGVLPKGTVLGRLAGTSPGDGSIPVVAQPVPPWVNRLLFFAASVAQSMLSRGRRVIRPVESKLQLGIYTPAIKQKRVPEPGYLVVLVDTSGSMWGSELIGALAMASNHLRSSSDVRTRLIAGDTEVTFNADIEGEFPAELAGGGGTDIVPLFEAADKLEPKAVICITDTFIQQWPQEPSYKCLWVIPENANDPPFGEVIRVPED